MSISPIPAGDELSISLQNNMLIMNKILLFGTIFLLSVEAAFSQVSFTHDPDSSVFLTSDINNFWMAFDHFKKDTTINPFGKEYIDIGSAGVKGFIPNRIVSAEHLFETVKQKTADYESAKLNSLRIHEKEQQCRSTFYALKYWYPDAWFPPVYFVIGAFNSGGTFNEDGLFIGAEKLTDINNVPYIVAHELIHFQQKNWMEYPTLLQQSIIEGSADFMGELISGVNLNKDACNYGDKNEDRLCKEFVARMDTADYRDWLYGVTGKDDRPNDLGYWIGYKITEQYFKKATDKRQAIRDILDIRDFTMFMKGSGYLDKYLSK
jgi:hypothetical protein